jgi:hypothetical protein
LNRSGNRPGGVLVDPESVGHPEDLSEVRNKVLERLKQQKAAP